MNLMVFVCRMWLLKVSIEIESGPMPHLHFCEQNVMWSFYSVDDVLLLHLNFQFHPPACSLFMLRAKNLYLFEILGLQLCLVVISPLSTF